MVVYIYIFILFLYILLYLVFLYLFDIILYLKNTYKILLSVSQFLILSKKKVSQVCLYESDFNLSQCDFIFIVKLYNFYSEAEMASMFHFLNNPAVWPFTNKIQISHAVFYS